MIDKIKEWLKALEEIFQTLISLIEIIKTYPSFFLVLALLVSFYSFFYWYANYYPATIAKAYFEAIGFQRHDQAWELLTQDYRNRRWSSQDIFRKAYATSAPYEFLRVTPKETSYRIYPTLFAKSLRFEAEYVLTERFTQEDIKKPEQKINSLWLQIQHPKNYDQLIDGTLDQTADMNPSLPLRRYYKTIVMLKRIKPILPKWLIYHMDFVEQGLKKPRDSQ